MSSVSLPSFLPSRPLPPPHALKRSLSNPSDPNLKIAVRIRSAKKYDLRALAEKAANFYKGDSTFSQNKSYKDHYNDLLTFFKERKIYIAKKILPFSEQKKREQQLIKNGKLFLDNEPIARVDLEQGKNLLWALGVDGAFRRKGIASRLLETVRSKGHAKHIRGLKLLVLPENQIARDMYIKLGFLESDLTSVSSYPVIEMISIITPKELKEIQSQQTESLQQIKNKIEEQQINANLELAKPVAEYKALTKTEHTSEDSTEEAVLKFNKDKRKIVLNYAESLNKLLNTINAELQRRSVR